jgi:hypothetical protein
VIKFIHADNWVDLGDRCVVEFEMHPFTENEFKQWFASSGLETVSSEIVRKEGRSDIYKALLKPKEK